MFSNLGPLFKTTFRQAESNDTRLHIPHEERDNPNRKKDEKEKDKEGTVWEDDMTVSIKALRSFLINFLKTLPGGEDLAQFEAQRQEEEIVKQRPPETSRPANTQSAKAVRAYQSMANRSEENRDREEPSPKEGDRQEPNAAMLKSKELRDVHALIDDLEILKREGVEQLHIKKADTFLEALQNAVKLLQSKV
jgi:hypothetical protein